MIPDNKHPYGPNSDEHGNAKTPRAVAKLGRQIVVFFSALGLFGLGVWIGRCT